MLTVAERAYRRGALQAIIFLKRDLQGLPESGIRHRLATWEQELLKARDSNNHAYLGRLLDTIMARVCLED